MPDKPIYAPGHRPAAQQPTHGDLLFSLRLGDQAADCELPAQVGAGWEAQFFIDGEFYRSRLFPTRELAEEWAVLVRQAWESGL